jgi:flagellar basal-body rod protein FlgF
MIRGIYSSASGMMAEMTRTDATANNLANANTTGYKKDVAVSKDFASVMITRINDGQNADIGSLGLGTVIDEVAVDQEAGTIRTTGNDLDMAVDGKGYFAGQTPNGVRYTRNGTFTRSSQGELVTQDGYQVLGQNGAPIRLTGTKFVVNADGAVFNNGIQTGQLQVVDFADERQLTKEGASLFVAAGNAQQQPASGSVRQGTLEMSNVNVVAEMVNLITGYRAYETNSKAVQAHDQLLDKAVNEVGKV